MVLELLDQRIDLSPCGPSPMLQGESIHHCTEDDTGEKPEHQPIGEHLIRHPPHLPARILAGMRKSLRVLNISEVYPKAIASVKQGRSLQADAGIV
jgi:hypothetical protein